MTNDAQREFEKLKTAAELLFGDVRGCCTEEDAVYFILQAFLELRSRTEREIFAEFAIRFKDFLDALERAMGQRP